jgi:hypothetical protein
MDLLVETVGFFEKWIFWMILFKTGLKNWLGKHQK